MRRGVGDLSPTVTKRGEHEEMNMSSKNQSTAAADSLVDQKQSSVEERLKHLEEAHKITRSQISRLNQAKSEVLRLKIQVEKSSLAREHKLNSSQQQVQEITKLGELIEKKEEECQLLKKKIVNITQQAQKDFESLRKQLEAAQDRVKLSEIEKVRLLRDGKDNFLKGVLIGLGFSILMAALAMGARYALHS
jgi:vacuolar-type H+-ATPase subunit I/STV1